MKYQAGDRVWLKNRPDEEVVIKTIIGDSYLAEQIVKTVICVSEDEISPLTMKEREQRNLIISHLKEDLSNVSHFSTKKMIEKEIEKYEKFYDEVDRSSIEKPSDYTEG